MLDMPSERVQGLGNLSELNYLLWEVSSLQAIVTLIELVRDQPDDFELSGELRRTLEARGESKAGWMVNDAELLSRRRELAAAWEHLFRYLQTVPL